VARIRVRRQMYDRPSPPVNTYATADAVFGSARTDKNSKYFQHRHTQPDSDITLPIPSLD